TAIAQETTARERERIACGRDTVARGNVRTAFRVARRAFWNERIARRGGCPARRTARCARQPRIWWSDLSKSPRGIGEDGPHPWPLSVPERGNSSKEGVMNAQLRRRLEMAGRVREFLRAHKTDGVGEGLGLAKLEELMQRAELLASQQRAGLVAALSTSKHRKGLRRALQSKLLLYLRAVAAVAAKEA